MKKAFLMAILILFSIAASAQPACEGTTCTDDEIKTMDTAQLQQIPAEKLTIEQANSKWTSLSQQQKDFFYKNNLNLFQDKFAQEKGIISLSGCTANCRFESGMLYNPPPETGFPPSSFKGFQVVADAAGGFRVKGVTTNNLFIDNNNYNLLGDTELHVAEEDSVKLPNGATIGFNSLILEGVGDGGELNVPKTASPNVKGNVKVSGNGIENTVDGFSTLLRDSDFSALLEGINVGNIHIGIDDSKLLAESTQKISIGTLEAQTEVPLGKPADYEASLSLHQSINQWNIDTSAKLKANSLSLKTTYEMKKIGSGEFAIETGIEKSSEEMKVGIGLTFKPG